MSIVGRYTVPVLIFVVPDANRVVQRAGGNERFADTDTQSCDGGGMPRLCQELKVNIIALQDI